LTFVEFSREVFAYSIALLVIGSFVYFFYYAITETTDLEMAKEVTALFGGYVAAVLVYYFGQKQAQTLTNTAVKAEKERDTAVGKVNIASSGLDDLTDERAIIKAQFKAEIEKLKRLEKDN